MITIYFDGLCEPAYSGGPRNPNGVATYGYVIYQNDNVIKKGCKAIGEGKGMTNNVAEYSALKRALEWLNEQNIDDKIIIKGDSQLVINQLKGIWRVKSETSQWFVPKINKLLENKDVCLKWIPREQNNEADILSRVAYKRYIEQRNK